MHERETRLHGLVEPTVKSLGFELVGVLWRRGRTRGLIRVYIDHEDGVTVDDCARVSHRVNGLIDLEDSMTSEYDLEVSSPGADRPLFFERDFVRFTGADLDVTLQRPVAGRRRFTGRLGRDAKTGSSSSMNRVPSTASRYPRSTVRGWFRNGDGVPVSSNGQSPNERVTWAKRF